MTRIALLSTSDTDLLSARSCGAEYAMANPSRLDLDTLPGLLDQRRPRRRAAARLGAVVAGRLRRRARLRPPGRRARRRADAGRGADEPLHRPGRHRGRGAPVPRRGRPGQPREPARLPLRHRPADRRGLRPARHPAGLGLGRATGEWRKPEREWRRMARHAVSEQPECATRGTRAGRRPVLPGARGERQQRFRARAGRRDRRNRCGRRRPDLQLVAAVGAGRPLRRARHPRRAGRHRARCRRHDAGLGERRRRRRGVGRRAHEGPRHPDPAGPLPHLEPRGVGGVRRGRHAARLGQPDRHPRVRRPHHHRAVLVQGDRRGRPAALRRRPRAMRAGGRHRRQPRATAPRPARRAQGRADAVGVPHQAQPGRQRGRPRHPGLGHPPAPAPARRGLRPRSGRR